MSIIKKVETILTCPGRNYLIVKITTNDGVVGYGDATLNGRELVVKTLIDEYFSEILTGMDSQKISHIWNYLFTCAYWKSGPIQMSAIAGVDMALWDIKGKYANMPVYNLLGGKSRDKVQTYIHAHGSNYNELKKSITEKIGRGYTCLRYSFDTIDSFDNTKCYKQPHQDISLGRIEVSGVQVGIWDAEQYKNDLINITHNLRQDFGFDLQLIHDTHGRLSLTQAVSAAKELDKCRLLFWEDPVEYSCKNEIERIRQISTTPLGIGELYNSFDDFSGAIKNNNIDYVRADISHYGGITATIKLALTAGCYHIKTAFHGPSDISPIAHAALAHINFNVQNFGIQETVEFKGDVLNVFSSPVIMEKNNMMISEKPGLGIEVDEEAAAKYNYCASLLPGLKDTLGAVHNW